MAVTGNVFAVFVFFVVSVFCSSCVCASGVSDHGGFPAPGLDNVTAAGNVSRMRSAAETAALTVENTQLLPTFILAANRTHRRDIFHGFSYYHGGWNISNRHYWASAGFAAIVPFGLCSAWFVFFWLAILLFKCYRFFQLGDNNFPYSLTIYRGSFILILFFLLVTIVGAVILFHAQEQAYTNWKGTLDYVFTQANITAENLRNFSDVLSISKQFGLGQVIDLGFGQNFDGFNQTSIDEAQARINTSTADLTHHVTDNAHKIRHGVYAMRVALIVAVAAVLLVILLGFVFSCLACQCFVRICAVFGWFLVTGTLLLSGVFLMLRYVTGDACVAMDMWVHNPFPPVVHTALDDILPCMDLPIATDSLQLSRETTFLIANYVNNAIANVTNHNFSPNVGIPFYFNQSGPLMPTLCNPLNSDLTDRTCGVGAVTSDNASQVWGNYVCNVSSSNVCTTVGRLTPDLYKEIVDAATVSYGLYRYVPFLIDLENCVFARDVYTTITQNHCPGVRKYTKRVFVCLMLVSAGVMLSLLLWVLYAREQYL